MWVGVLFWFWGGFACLVLFSRGILLAYCKGARDFVAFLHRVTQYVWMQYSSLQFSGILLPIPILHTSFVSL